MKKLTLLSLFLFLVFLCIQKDPVYAQDRSYYTLSVSDVAPKNINFTNKTNMDLRVILYKENDNVMAIGFKTLTIKAGKSASYRAGTYNVKVYKDQLIDKHLKTQKNVSGDFRMSGTEKKFSTVRLSARKNTVFKNKTGKSLKIRLYKRNDNTKAVPFETYTLKDNTSTATYNGDEKSFFVSVYDDKLIDELLITQICPDQSVITVNEK